MSEEEEKDTVLRVLSVIHPFRPAFSGEGEWWLRLVPRLRKRAVAVDVLTRSMDRGEPNVVEGPFVHRIRIDESAPYHSWIRAMLRLLSRSRKRYPLVLFHSPNDDGVYASCIAGRLFGWKTVYKMTLQGADDLLTIRSQGKLGAARLASLGLAHGYIAMSRFQIRGFESSRFLQGRTLIAPQGVDTRTFRPPSADEVREARRRVGVPPGAPTALFCGGIVRRKGVDVLVEAWSAVRRSQPDAQLLLVGPNHRDGLTEPEYRLYSEGVERRIGELGLGNSIRLLGYQRDMVPFYRASDLFVLPSRNEGWGSVITEAMACGLPCIISRLDGLAEEHLTGGVEGYVIDDSDPARWAARIVDLFDHPIERERVGRRACARAFERFDIERVADAYASFLRKVAGPPLTPRESLVGVKLARAG